MDNSIDKRIVKFIKRHHVLTLATVDSHGLPYCSNLFYAYDQSRNLFIFTSSLDTQHGAQMVANDVVAASVVLETKVVGRIEGLQITGRVSRAEAELKECYLAKYPYAAVAPLTLWQLEPHFLKFTDNKLGFGVKLIWNRE